MTTNDQLHGQDAVNFFISYTGSDVEWAKWIAWELARAGYTYRMQAEHFPPGARFINEMRVWLQKADHVLALLSPAYFESPFASLEMQSAVAEDPLGEARRVIPVRIEQCSMPTLFRDLVYIDFVGKPEEEQRRALTAGLRAAMVGSRTAHREIKERPVWPGSSKPRKLSTRASTSDDEEPDDLPLRVQFIACDVGRGLDLKGQYNKIKAAIGGSRFSKQIRLHPEFDVTDTNLFAKLNSYRPHVVHISGNQNGGDVLLPSSDGGEVVVPDEALAGVLSSLGSGLRLAIIDTCKSYRCAKRVSEAVECAVGVDDDIYDNEAIRFYEVFYQAIGAGHSIADAHGQATAALQFMQVPKKRIPKLCVKPGQKASQLFLVGKRPPT
jgi:hypothetical protein